MMGCSPVDPYSWIAERFGDWSFPKLFLATKA